MRRVFVIIAVSLVFLIGLSVLLYPYAADYVNSLNQSRVVARYYEDTAAVDTAEADALLKKAEDYNRALAQNPNRFKLTEAELAEYYEQMRYRGSEIMGIIAIDKIDVRLPVYHGTSEGVLQIGAGHFEGTSIPVGGLGTHAVITGHRGVPSSTLLTHLDQMEIGDTFVVTALNRTLTYMVDQIVVVEPDELEALAIDAEKDYCTLVTCTPYGINSHRMLVRGIRTANEAEETVEEQAATAEEAERTDQGKLLIFGIAAATGIAAVAAIARIWKWRRGIRQERRR
ncbi:MAG: class C sortase [Clostridiales bacterium]|jgi:sortase A|nr:class C sortase [Clostridiales bacterium]